MRRFETDYAGAWRGHCKTRENAVIAAMRHIVRDGYSRCTITDTITGEVVARIRLTADRKSATVDAVQQFKKIGEQS
jgi:hypothetical protein